MGDIETAGVPADVATRLLNFLNYASRAAVIAGNEPVHGPILDDPSTGYGDNVEDYDIGMVVAERIIDRRDSLPGNQFTDLAQLSGIDYLGQDKFDDLVYTFSRYWELLLDVNRFDQETGFYCGAASAQMILDYLHNWGGDPDISQDDLYNTIQTHKEDTGFYTDPDGLVGCLNDESPAANRWLVYAGGAGYQAKVTRKLAVTMNQYDAPPAALVFDGDHWVVISGVTATEEPSMGKQSFIIYTVRVHDPGRGSNVREVEYSNWCNNYMTRNTWGTKWDNQYVVVVDPKVEEADVRFPMPNYKTSGRRRISPEDAVKYAQESLVDYHLTDRKDYRDALEGTAPGEPVLFKNLRLKSKRFCYLVPFEKGDRTRVVVMVNTYFGNYMGSSIVDKPKGYLDIRADRAKTLVQREVADKPGVSAEDVREPWLVWKPSRESWDPFEPVWKTTARGRRRYVNQKGEISSRLRKVRKGGM